MRVVHDTDASVALWRPRGTVRKVPVTPPTRERAATRTQRLMQSLSLCDWVLVDHVWDVDNLWLMRPGEWSAIWVGWRPVFENYGWYVNLQEPFVRTDRGFQMMDMMLDVIVDPDRTWHWKDEDDFQGLRDFDLIDASTAELVRAEAERVITDVEANRPPFCDEWHDWRPDAGWGIPVLPDDWERY
jgi:hypothetical protein